MSPSKEAIPSCSPLPEEVVAGFLHLLIVYVNFFKFGKIANSLIFYTLYREQVLRSTGSSSTIQK
jgi:hypothetical protein